MGRCLGIDTSNYTTSAALYDDEKGNMYWKKKLLPVKEGAVGLRSTEVVFAHIKQIEEMVRAVMEESGGEEIDAVAVSECPRDAEGSYMPCFLVGKAVAGAIAAVKRVPIYYFSHQSGHIAAALYSAGRFDLFDEEFISFHVSGGTTECLFVSPDEERGFKAEIIGESLDLNAGQAVDRVGNMLGMPFPAGAYLENTALEYKGESSIKVNIAGAVKDGNCCISGIENKCRKYIDEGKSAGEVANYLFEYIYKVLDKMTEYAAEKCGALEVVYAGGVMSNGIIKEKLGANRKCVFAKREFSSDNACGTAILGSMRLKKEKLREEG